MTVPPGILKRWNQEGPGSRSLCGCGGVALCGPGKVSVIGVLVLSRPVPFSPYPLLEQGPCCSCRPPSCNQSLWVASEPGGGGQVNIGPRGPGLPRLLHLLEPRSSSRSPGRSPQAWPRSWCVLGTPMCVEWASGQERGPTYSTAGTCLF